jgi:hypothetical protein
MAMSQIVSELSFLERAASLRNREKKGSRIRCLRLTDGSDHEVAMRLSAMTSPAPGRLPLAVIDPERHRWLPKGLASPDEAKLDRAPELLPPELRGVLKHWWLAVPKGANTPNWDIAATCTIGDREGLLLVEAKAHANELHTDGCGSTRLENQRSIAAAVNEANAGLTSLCSGWSLQTKSCFQLCNRFALSWKLAAQGVPVVLVYLGFLNVTEMPKPLISHDQWRNLVIAHAKGLVPDAAWDATFDVGGMPLTALIRSAHIDLE